MGPPNGNGNGMQATKPTAVQPPAPVTKEHPAVNNSSNGANPVKLSTIENELPKGGVQQNGARQSTRQPSGSRRVIPWYVVCARKTVDNSIFMAFTTFLTFYALTGDDLRVLLTEKPADIVFNINGIICIVVFSIEVVLSCLGKNDYYLGFFFGLDVISTATLVLDLTWVSEAIQGNSDASNMRSGRTARVGARAGRVVRVLRLVRILKLYKAYYEAKQRKAEAARKKAQGEEDDWDESDYEAVANAENKENESRVGKKLSEMTTRRVICLILAMLLALPLLSIETASQTLFSSEYGANHVWQGFDAMVKDNSTMNYHDYNWAALNYAYYHNWYVSNFPDKYCPSSSCSGMYLGGLFFVGLSGNAGGDSFQNALKYTSLDPTMVDDFEKTDGQEKLVAYGLMPPEVKAQVTKPWSQQCKSASGEDIFGFSLINQDIPETSHYRVFCPDDLRPTEIQAFAPSTLPGSQLSDLYLVFYFDMRPFNKESSGFSLGVTFFVMVLLVAASMTFTSDANRLVLQPVEKMIERVEAIREKPLLAMKMADDEFKAEEIKKARIERARRSQLNRLLMDAASLCKSADKEIMETVILEKTIIKLGSLLALGFGEAGADIIGKNMSGSDSAGVNAMVPGRKCECIVGIMRVRDFSTATEVLQAKVMMFSNQIAEIVHGVCSEFHGAPNKNTGESFLVIWKQEKHEEHGESTQMKQFAEGSLVAAATIIGGVHRSPLLGSYREHPGLQNRLGSNCRVHLSVGLHKGWAIEGAVGSEFKIDCSYLSPNVSIATSVERATEIYGVSLTVAQSVVDQCGQDMRSRCRLIDKVIITGSPAPMELYCVDLDYMSVDIDRSARPKVNWTTRQRFKVRQWMEQEKAAVMAKDVVSIFDSDEVIAAMRQRFTVEFFQLFNMGYQNYSQGEWQVARRMLSSIKDHIMDDGPSTALLRFMEAPHQFEAPKGWQGVRELATM
eukprot:gb/GFBE01008812.1/.p1 GENE.gb/GFBE01008812.1/~~gb/GFBE01008812.1/.p1  ORF type:complete len:959 (+),score=205.21 gb/GFBE01008812.1/:1-2877(+)